MRLIGKLCVFTFFLFGIGLGLCAQEYGAKASFGFSGISGFKGGSIHLGPQFGAYLKLGTSENLYFQTEFLITYKGGSSSLGDVKQSLYLMYIELPLMFGLNISRRVSLNAGVQQSMVLFGRLTESTASGKTRTKIGSHVTRFDYSTLLGGEYFINDQWTAGVRFNYSFVPLANYNNEIIRNTDLLHSRIVQLYACYKLSKP